MIHRKMNDQNFKVDDNEMVPKIVENNTEGANIVDVTLNSDCLEAIFNFLDYGDLLNVALAVRRHDQINGALDNVFKRKSGQSPVHITNCSKLHRNIQFVKRFGNRITKLSLRFCLSKFTDLCDSVVESCKDNVTELRLDYNFSDEYYVVGGHWNCNTNSNPNLNRARVFFSELPSQFPNLERLSIYRNGDPFSREVETWHRIRIPSMTHFKFSDTIEDPRFDRWILKSFIAFNTQLRSLSLPINLLPPDSISFLDERLPNLTCLKFRSYCWRRLRININKANHLTNLKKLKFKVNDPNKILDFKFLSETLDYLKVQEVQDTSNFSVSKLVKIASNFVALKKLKLIVPSRVCYAKDGRVFDREICFDELKIIASHQSSLKQLTKVVLKFEVKGDLCYHIDDLSTFGSWNVNVNVDKGTFTFDKA